jgi:hypothetical protein
MNRSRLLLRDAALGYASRGIPVLPLHYPLSHRGSLQSLTDGRPMVASWPSLSCSCRDPGCGQVGKHPLGSLVPHGVRDATTNRARILAWWIRHPQANIGLATGHTFDVLDVDGAAGTQAIRELAAMHGLVSAGPLVRTGGGWHFYLAPTGLGNVHPAGLECVDWRGQGGYVVAPPSRHATGHPYQWVPGRDLDTPPGQAPAVLLERLQPQQRHRPTSRAHLPVPSSNGPSERYAWAALAEELAQVATAPKGQRNRQLWESTRNLYNLVATGALNPREVDQGLLTAAERCGLLAEEPRQTHRTLASGRQVGLAHPGRPAQPTSPERTHPWPPRRVVGEPVQERR